MDWIDLAKVDEHLPAMAFLSAVLWAMTFRKLLSNICDELHGIRVELIRKNREGKDV